MKRSKMLDNLQLDGLYAVLLTVFITGNPLYAERAAQDKKNIPESKPDKPAIIVPGEPDTTLPELNLSKKSGGKKNLTPGEQRLAKMKRRHQMKINLIKKNIEVNKVSKKEGARQLKEQKKIHQMEKKALMKEINYRSRKQEKAKKKLPKQKADKIDNEDDN